MKVICWQNRKSETFSENSDPYYFCTVSRNICKDIFDINLTSTMPSTVTNSQRIRRQDRIVSSTQRIVPTLPTFKHKLDDKYFQSTPTSKPVVREDTDPNDRNSNGKSDFKLFMNVFK